jgi:ATP-binding cassette subfamily B protein
MVNGEIVERGKHAELLEQQGVYYDLYMSQFKRQEQVTQATAPRPNGHGPALTPATA